MKRAWWVLMLAAPVYGQRICVETVLSTNNETIRQNKTAVEGLAQTLIDDVFIQNNIRYYEYVPNQANRTDCTHVVFLFDWPAGGELMVRARIEKTYTAALHDGPAIIPGCAPGFTTPAKLEDFEWKKAVTHIMPCLSDSFRNQETRDRLHRFALVARNVQDRCYGDSPTPSCLVLPLPFAPPYNRLAKSSFRIVAPYDYGPEFDVTGFGRGQCAKYSDRTDGDLRQIKADLDNLASLLAAAAEPEARKEAQARLVAAGQVIAGLGAAPSTLSRVPPAIADLVASLEKLNPGVPEAAARLKTDGLRLEANMKTKPIDEAIAVILEGDDVKKVPSADWAFSRVEVLRVDDNIPERCSPWREPPARSIPLPTPPPAPPRTPPGGPN